MHNNIFHSTSLQPDHNWKSLLTTDSACDYQVVDLLRPEGINEIIDRQAGGYLEVLEAGDSTALPGICQLCSGSSQSENRVILVVTHYIDIHILSNSIAVN